jgi:hypothetical protein
MACRVDDFRGEIRDLTRFRREMCGSKIPLNIKEALELTVTVHWLPSSVHHNLLRNLRNIALNF